MDKRISEFRGRFSRLSKEVASLGERIKAGEDSLGSKVDNFCFCNFGLDLGRWKSYLDLNDEVKDGKGKEVLVVRNRKEKVRNGVYCRGEAGGVDSGVIAPRVSYKVDEQYNYGVLSGKGLDFDLSNGDIIFPTGRWHVGFSNSTYSGFLVFQKLSLKRFVVELGFLWWNYRICLRKEFLII